MNSKDNQAPLRIAFLYIDGRLRRIDRVRTSEAGSDFLYGATELQRKGCDVRCFELASVPPNPLLQVAGDFLSRRRVLVHKLDGAILGTTWKLIRQINDYDVVVVASSPLSYGMAYWKWLGFLRPEIVAIQCGMLNFEYTSAEKFWTRRLQRQMWTLLFGEGEFMPFRRFVGPELERRVIVNECGTDTAFWTPGDKDGDEGYILSVGNDGRRDYDLLMRVAAKVNLPFVLLTRAHITEAIPENVRIIGGDLHKELLTDIDVRDLYRKARLVVIPLKKTLQPSGQSVCLQAMACRKAVVISDIEGIWSRAKMRNGENVVLVPSGDEDAMARAVTDLYQRTDVRQRIAAAGFETTCREWDMIGYANRIEQACQMAAAAVRSK